MRSSPIPLNFPSLLNTYINNNVYVGLLTNHSDVELDSPGCGFFFLRLVGVSTVFGVTSPLRGSSPVTVGFFRGFFFGVVIMLGSSSDLSD
mgnify:CR=1 FL=1